MKWSTSDGRVLDVRDMSTDHLINSIAYTWRTVALHSRGLCNPNAVPMKGDIENCKTVLSEMMDELARRDRTAHRQPVQRELDLSDWDRREARSDYYPRTFG